MNDHERAKTLIAAIELPENDARWLADHLAECGSCARLHRSAAAATAALRSLSITADAPLVRATQRLVRARSLQMSEAAARQRMMWIGIGIGTLIGIFTTPLLWFLAGWIGRTYSLPALTWQAMFFALWFIPASFAAAVALACRPAALEDAGRGER